MTDEELEKKAKEYVLELYRKDEFAFPFGGVEMRQAYIAGAKENGVVWHDLQKNPNDLPKENCEVIVIFENENACKQGWLNGNWTNAIVVPIVAWCEIPKFEEE